MGLGEAEQWWERWQLRVLVLGSLSLQFFLLVVAALRRRRCVPWFRLLTWAAYLGSDAIAIYALATLFTRHKKQQLAGGTSPSPSSHGAAALEALWAPVLLLHLGGQDGITAYSIQDNELWRRHLFTAASQVAIAVYVFRKSWPQGGDGRVLAAAILLFFPGILKCLQKPWALGKSSTSSIAAAVGASNSEQQDTSRSSSKQKETSIEEFVHQTSLVYKTPKQEVGNDNDDDDDQARLEVIHHLFVDLPYPYSVRLKLLKQVWPKEPKGAHVFVRSDLSRTFDRLYTAGYTGYLSALLVLLVASSVVLIIVTCRSRGAYVADDDADVDLKLTYVLLCCTAGLEVVSAVTMVCIRMMGEPPWPDQVAQCNLIGYLVHNEAHGWVRRLASLLGCQAYLDWVWCTSPSRTARPSSSSSSDSGIADLIYDHTADQWKELPDGDASTEHYIKNTRTYRRFSDRRGQWTLDKEKEACGCPLELASSSLRRPFDESVMVWHLATDMCFFHSSVGDELSEKVKRQCRTISNYMAYLLLVNPEMLMPGSRRRIFTVAYNQVRETIVKGESPDDEDDLKKVPLPPGGNQDMARMLIQKARTPLKTTKEAVAGIDPPSSESIQTVKTTKTTKDAAAGIGTPSSRSLVHDAWALAEELMEKEVETWRLICGVWAEMLCFSASRCRGYLHAKSLATGGEYLSYVWLLRAYMGMETLAHIMQETEEGDVGADELDQLDYFTAQPPPVVAGSENV